MNIKFNISNLIRTRKLDDLIDIPVIIRVIKFDDDGVRIFNEDITRALYTKQPIIPIVIDSYGGLIDGCISMSEIITSIRRTERIKIATIVEGKAMSSGVTLFTFGDDGYRFMAPNARLAIHQVSSSVAGKNSDIQSDANETNRINNMLFKIMAKNCKQPDDYFVKLLVSKNNSDWYMTAKEAKKHNITNHLHIPNFRINVNVKYVFN